VEKSSVAILPRQVQKVPSKKPGFPYQPAQREEAGCHAERPVCDLILAIILGSVVSRVVNSAGQVFESILVGLHYAMAALPSTRTTSGISSRAPAGC
jgi:hypothetical protein